jgi:hypothetical protein
MPLLVVTLTLFLFLNSYTLWAEESMKAEDLMRKLAEDQDFVAMRNEKEKQRTAAAAKNQLEEASLVQELRDAHVRVKLFRIPGKEYEGTPNSVWDLVNSEVPYPEAVPILVKHLRCDYSQDIKEGIIRALAVKEAGDEATDRLIEEFVSIKDPDSDLKWVIGLSIAATTTEKSADKVAKLALDKAHGKSRGELPLGMLNVEPAKAISYLQAMVDDPVTSKNAKKALKKIQE